MLIDGNAVRSCVTPLSSVGKKKIVTLEGLGTTENPAPLQKAFIAEQAAQCGYCINGMIMEAAAFLAHNKTPSEAQIKQALAHNLCRCGTHLRIVRAVKRAADECLKTRLTLLSDKPTRRDFLKATGILIVSFSLPSFLSTGDAQSRSVVQDRGSRRSGCLPRRSMPAAA